MGTLETTSGAAGDGVIEAVEVAREEAGAELLVEEGAWVKKNDKGMVGTEAVAES